LHQLLVRIALLEHCVAERGSTRWGAASASSRMAMLYYDHILV
jgi:hypothetical protein